MSRSGPTTLIVRIKAPACSGNLTSGELGASQPCHSLLGAATAQMVLKDNGPNTRWEP